MFQLCDRVFQSLQDLSTCEMSIASLIRKPINSFVWISKLARQRCLHGRFGAMAVQSDSVLLIDLSDHGRRDKGFKFARFQNEAKEVNLSIVLRFEWHSNFFHAAFIRHLCGMKRFKI
jgi:hypothetical protein